MPRAAAGFVSFTEITDPAAHRAYNAWHQLDHLPEQLALPGIVAGRRWVSTPACTAARRTTGGPLAAAHYVTLYLLAEPLRGTLAGFAEAARRLRDAGRFFAARRSLLSGAFVVTDRWAAPRVQVSAEAVAHRPDRGVYVVVEPGSTPGDGRVAGVLKAAVGVAGVWAFEPARVEGAGRPGAHRLTVAFVDDDAVAVADAVAGDLPPSAELTFAGPFAPVDPWHWDWFDP